MYRAMRSDDANHEEVKLLVRMFRYKRSTFGDPGREDNGEVLIIPDQIWGSRSSEDLEG